MAITFDGSTDYWKATMPIPASYPVTMSLWMKSDLAASPAHSDVAMSIGKSSSTTEYLSIWSRATGSTREVRAQVNNTSGAETVISGGGIDVGDGAWYCVTGVLESATVRTLFVNGTKHNGTGTSHSFPSGLNQFACGALWRTTVALHFTGKAGEFAVWTAALSDGECASLAAGWSPMFIQPGLLSFYSPLVEDLYEADVKGSLMTQFGTPVSYAHPPIIYPTSPHFPGPATVDPDAGIPQIMNSYRRRRVG